MKMSMHDAYKEATQSLQWSYTVSVQWVGTVQQVEGRTGGGFQSRVHSTAAALTEGSGGFRPRSPKCFDNGPSFEGRVQLFMHLSLPRSPIVSLGGGLNISSECASKTPRPNPPQQVKLKKKVNETHLASRIPPYMWCFGDFIALVFVT